MEEKSEGWGFPYPGDLEGLRGPRPLWRDVLEGGHGKSRCGVKCV